MAQQNLFGQCLTEKDKKKIGKQELSEELDEELSEELADDGSEELTVITTKEKIIEQCDEKDKYGWQQLPKQEKRKEKGVAYIHIQLFSSTNLNGTQYAVYLSQAHEMPNGMLGGMWGSGGESFDINKLDEIQNYFDELMELKKYNLKNKYREFTDSEQKIGHEHHYLYYEFRLIPASNYFIIISDKLVEMLKKTGFDFEKWYEEYRALPENKATDEDWQKALKMIDLMEKGDALCKKLEAMDKINKTNKELRDTVDFFTKTKEEFEQEFDEMPMKLKEVSDEIAGLQREIGSSCCSTPFGWELEHYGRK